MVLGNSEQLLQGLYNFWESADSDYPNDPYLISIRPQYQSIFSNLNDDINSLHEGVNKTYQESIAIAGTITAVYASSDSTGSLVPFTSPTNSLNVTLSLPTPDFYMCEIEENKADKIRKIDTSLADSYQEVYQILFGTNADPERGACFQIRQTFDHLIDILAPKNEVRKSEYWKPKKPKTIEKKSDQVFRNEQLEFAIRENINDPEIQDKLVNEMKIVLQNYKILNEVHKRGEIDKEKEVKAIRATKKLLDEIIGNIDIEKYNKSS